MSVYVYPKKDEDEYYDNTVYLPVVPEQVSGLKVGQEVEVVLRGKLEMVSSREDSGRSTAELRIVLSSSEVKDSEQMSAVDELFIDD